MESEAVRRLVAALTDTGYNARVLTDGTVEFIFGRNGYAFITVKEWPCLADVIESTAI